MLNSKTIISGVIGGIVLYLLGWLFYGILLMDFFEANSGTATNVMRAPEEMVMWSLVLGHLVWGYTFAYIFNHWANINTWDGGAKAGALLGVLISMSFNMIWFGTSNLGTMVSGVADVFVTGIMCAIAGAVIGWWLGRGQ